MLGRFWAVLTGGHPSAESDRRQLLKRFPKHLDLIDSREIPHEYSKGPDLSYYTESASYYYDLILESAPHLKDKPRAVTAAERKMASVANNRIVNATWGLIARGADAVPFAVRLVCSSDRDHREAAAGVFCGLRDPDRLPEIVSQIHTAIDSEHDQSVLDTLLAALGKLQSRSSIPTLARFVLDESIDGDTRHTAATSLSQIVRKKFQKPGADPVGLACDWLAVNGFTKA
jgi:hypothetical protein